MKKLIFISILILVLSSQVLASEEPSLVNLEAKGVKEVARCIMKLRPMTTPYMAVYIAANIVQESSKKGLDPYLVLGVIFAESHLNPNAESKMGALGLMQVRYITWKLEPELKSNGVDVRHKLFWIDANIKAGTDILARFIKEAGGNIGTALYRYNTGIPKLIKNPWEIEYVSKVLYYTYRIKQHIMAGTKLDAEDVLKASHPVRNEILKKK
jgi:soluble lytic murein transglycosylase-like protein